jgi:hypothetical protein
MASPKPAPTPMPILVPMDMPLLLLLSFCAELVDCASAEAMEEAADVGGVEVVDAAEIDVNAAGSDVNNAGVSVDIAEVVEDVVDEEVMSSLVMLK